jgi:hypothetical protein
MSLEPVQSKGVMFMKPIKTTFVAGIVFVLMALATLAACGGSGGSGCSPAPAPIPGPGPEPEPGGGSGCGPVPEPIPEPGPTRTWYVSLLRGDDNNNGLSIDTPLQSVMKALQKAAADKAAYPDKWKKGVSAKIVILDLSGPTEITLDDTYPPITLGGTPENPATINGTLTITGGDANSPPVTLAHVTLNGGGSDVVKVEGGNLVIEDGAVITGGGNGVVVISGGAVTLSGDSRIWGISGNGVEMTGGAFNMTGGEIGANGKNGVKTSGGGVFTKRGGGTVYGNGGSVPTDLRNTRGSINDIPKTFVPDDNF